MVLLDQVGDDSSKLKSSPVPRKKTFFASLVSNIFSILVFSAIVFVFINFPAFLLISKFKISPQSVAIQGAESSNTNEPTEVKQFEDNTIFIPRIGVKTPIIWDVGSGEVMDKLQNGVVHIEGTGHIDEQKNTFLTGHSSNYWWRGGDYNSVFALLPQLEKGDEIFVTYHGKLEKFTVSDKKEVKKQDVSDYLLSDKKQLTLMTCVPVGTNLRRMLIFAN